MSRYVPVLAIEGDEVVRKALRHSLKLHGFQVHLAKGGSEGLKLAQEIKPALILLDPMVQEIGGLHVLSELKRGKETQGIPVFILAAGGMIGDLDQAFEMGADDYVTKPSDLMQVGRMVKAKWESFTGLPTAR